jgi:hypothetical protein
MPSSVACVGLASLLSVRTGGVALAIAYLLETPIIKSDCCKSNLNNTPGSSIV